MEHFTPISASIGGLLIGLSATLLWIANGRIAGISGIVGGLWTARANDIAWRIAFVLGLIAAPAVYWMAGGELPPITVSVPWPVSREDRKPRAKSNRKRDDRYGPIWKIVAWRDVPRRTGRGIFLTTRLLDR